MTPIESLPAKLEPCGDCGMPCAPGEYHPYAACLMFKACHNSETVRANLQALATQPKDGELLASLLNRPNRVWRSESETGTEELARGIVIDPIELRTLASRRVEVDEAMVERAARKAWGVAKFGVETADWDRAPEIRKTFVRDFARAALAAALQPDSGEG